MAIRFLICHFAPRPAAEPAVRALNLGLALPPGLGRSAVRASWFTPYWRMRRRYHPARQFHALGARGAQMNTIVRAALVYGLGVFAVRPLAGPADQVPFRRSRHPDWKPWRRVLYGWDDRGIRYSRYSARTYEPRPRTKFAYSPTRAKYFTRRRDLVARALARGYERIKVGLWYDRAADVVYNQSAVDLRPIEHVQLRRWA